LSITTPLSLPSQCKILSSSTSLSLLPMWFYTWINICFFYMFSFLIQWVFVDLFIWFGLFLNCVSGLFCFSGVDLRSSKICEPGFLNYKAKHVFYPYNRSKFRCRYDYYWASVFEVILSCSF
jgi:hypothetical protein